MLHGQPSLPSRHAVPLRQRRIEIRAVALQQRIVAFPEIEESHLLLRFHRPALSARQRLIETHRQLRLHARHHLHLEHAQVAQRTQEVPHRMLRLHEAVGQFARGASHLPPLQRLLSLPVTKLTTDIQVHIRLCRGKGRARIEHAPQ